MVALDKLDESNHSLVEAKIPGISTLNNYKFVGGKLTAWRAYGIGSGKVIMKDLKTGSIKVACKLKYVHDRLFSFLLSIDYNYRWLNAQFSFRDFRAMAPKTNKRSKVTPTEESSSELQEEEEEASKLYSCPQDGCVKVFQRFVTRRNVFAACNAILIQRDLHVTSAKLYSRITQGKPAVFDGV